MTRERHNSLLIKENGEMTLFKNNEITEIKGKGKTGKEKGVETENVNFVEGLEHNLISVSQLCDNGLQVIFRSEICEKKKVSSGETVLNGIKKKNAFII
jgi:hypothetical protein